jgi:hypothetical protein
MMLAGAQRGDTPCRRATRWSGDLAWRRISTAAPAGAHFSRRAQAGLASAMRSPARIMATQQITAQAHRVGPIVDLRHRGSSCVGMDGVPRSVAVLVLARFQEVLMTCQSGEVTNGSRAGPSDLVVACAWGDVRSSAACACC